MCEVEFEYSKSQPHATSPTSISSSHPWSHDCSWRHVSYFTWGKQLVRSLQVPHFELLLWLPAYYKHTTGAKHKLYLKNEDWHTKRFCLGANGRLADAHSYSLTGNFLSIWFLFNIPIMGTVLCVKPWYRDCLNYWIKIWFKCDWTFTAFGELKWNLMSDAKVVHFFWNSELQCSWLLWFCYRNDTFSTFFCISHVGSVDRVRSLTKKNILLFWASELFVLLLSLLAKIKCRIFYLFPWLSGFGLWHCLIPFSWSGCVYWLFGKFLLLKTWFISLGIRKENSVRDLIPPFYLFIYF